MTRWQEFRIFQKVATAIFLTFMGLLIYVVFVAFTRSSGNTGLDMGKVQQIRYEALQAKQQT